jgi:hypothetical protein
VARGRHDTTIIRLLTPSNDRIKIAVNQTLPLLAHAKENEDGQYDDRLHLQYSNWRGTVSTLWPSRPVHPEFNLTSSSCTPSMQTTNQRFRFSSETLPVLHTIAILGKCSSDDRKSVSPIVVAFQMWFAYCLAIHTESCWLLSAVQQTSSPLNTPQIASQEHIQHLVPSYRLFY